MLQQMLGGLVEGGAYAAIAVCIVLMYQMLGTLNFAQSAIGALGACVSLWAFTLWGLNAWLSTILAVVSGGILGALLGLVMARWFLETSVVTRTTVTIGIMVGSIAIGTHILNGKAYKFPDVFGGASVQIAGTGVPVGSLVEVGVALALAFAVQLFLTKTRVGTQLRAMSDRPTTAELLGVRVRYLTVGVWAFAGAMSTVAVMFVLPTSTTSFPPLAYLTIYALGAALLGLLRNMVVAAVGGLAFGMLMSLILTTPASRYAQAIPFIIIIVVMAWWRRGDVWSEAR